MRPETIKARRRGSPGFKATAAWPGVFAGYTRQNAEGALDDHSASAGSLLARVAGNVSFAGPPDHHQVFTDPRHPWHPPDARATFRSAASWKTPRLAEEPLTGSSCRSCRPVPCAPLSSGDQGCQDGQKTARGRHFLRPPFAGSKPWWTRPPRRSNHKLQARVARPPAARFGKAEAQGEGWERPSGRHERPAPKGTCHAPKRQTPGASGRAAAGAGSKKWTAQRAVRATTILGATR